MNSKNTVKEILNKRGFKEFKPTKELLEKLGINAWRFKKIIENKLEMTLSELADFAIWLDVPVEDLIMQNADEPPSFSPLSLANSN
ncbi:hypothetical protein [Pedobacter jeongneungensis]|uniref:hypothetical protein n=1 Tax=Pedobacter jeongneungensis TaxID=947309 RepID=UPI000468D2AB|nr:hypothetical protein [Pedobacter jeongneungensis]